MDIYGSYAEEGHGGVRRGPPEWGALLYQEEWANTKTRAYPGQTWVGYLGTVAGMVIILVTIFVLPFGDIGLLTCGSVLIIGIVVLLASLVVVATMLKRMPFRVYHLGFTLTSVSMMKGFFHKETFIPFSAVRSIKLESKSVRYRTVRSLVIAYVDQRWRERTETVHFWVVGDPLKLCQALRTAATDKMDPSVHEYMDHEQRREQTTATADGAMGSVSERGRLLSQMSPEQIVKAKRTDNVFALVILFVGVIGLLLSMAYWPEGDAIDVAFCTVIPLLLVGACFLLGVVILVVVRNRTPIRVYEHGVEGYALVKGTHFMPWGYFSTAKESEIGDSKSLTLKRETGAYFFYLTSDLPGYDEWSGMIKERVGDPTYGVEVVVGGSTRRYWLIPVIFALMGLTLGMFAAFVTRSDWDGLITARGDVFGVIMAMLSALGFFFLLQITLMFNNVFGIAVGRFSMAAVSACVVVILLIFAAALSASAPFDVRMDIPIIRSPDPGHTTIGPGEYVGEDLYASGPVRVGGNEELNLTDCTLTFDPAPGTGLGIWVHENGSLNMLNTTVTSVDTSIGFSFEVYGSANIVGCTIEATAADPDHMNGDGGLEIYSDDVRLIDTTFVGALSAAVMTVGCSPFIDGCTFSRALDEGIEAHDGAPKVTACTFQYCEWPVVLWRSNATFENCTFEYCPRGFDINSANPTIRGCLFTNITDHAISHSPDSSPVLEGNVFIDVGGETRVYEYDPGWGTFCAMVGVVLALTGLTIVYKLNKRRPRVDKQDSELEMGRSVW